jgi:hypothetical protein
MGNIFLMVHASITDFQRIWIIPASRPSIRSQSYLMFQIMKEGKIEIFDIY